MLSATIQPQQPSHLRNNITPASDNPMSSEPKPDSTVVNDPLAFSPALTVSQVTMIDGKASLQEVDVTRRIMLMTLTLTPAELLAFASDVNKQDAYLDTLENITTYCDQLQSLLDMARAAQARMIIVGEQVGPNLEASVSREQPEQAAA